MSILPKSDCACLCHTGKGAHIGPCSCSLDWLKPYSDEYDFVHASQEALCEQCHVRLGDHPMAEEIIGWQDLPFLHKDCLGRLYKL